MSYYYSLKFNFKKKGVDDRELRTIYERKMNEFVTLRLFLKLWSLVFGWC